MRNRDRAFLADDVEDPGASLSPHGSAGMAASASSSSLASDGSHPSLGAEREKRGIAWNSKSRWGYYLSWKSYLWSRLFDGKFSSLLSSFGSSSVVADGAASAASPGGAGGSVLAGTKTSREHSSFRVIGVEIGWLSPFAQYAFCAAGVMIFLILYGILQEHVVMNKFKRSLGWFVTFLQLGGYGIFANLMDSFMGNYKKEHKIPLYMYIILGFLQVIMQGFTNLSMKYLNYPAKTMFKSSRVIMTMLVGVGFMGKKYTKVEYTVGMCILVGLSVFVIADAGTSPEFSLRGLVLILLAVVADATILNIQDHCLVKYQTTHDELIYYSFSIAAVFAAAISFITGEFKDGFEFLGSDGIIQVLVLFIFFTLFGFLGMSCLAALTKRFGAMKSAVTSTIRKGFTLVASYVLFPEGKHFELLHLFGVVIFLGGLFLDSTTKLRSAVPHNDANMLSEEDEEIGIMTGKLNEAEEQLDSIGFSPKLDFLAVRENTAVATATSSNASASSLIERRKTSASVSGSQLGVDTESTPRASSSSSALGSLLIGSDAAADGNAAPKEL